MTDGSRSRAMRIVVSMLCTICGANWRFQPVPFRTQPPIPMEKNMTGLDKEQRVRRRNEWRTESCGLDTLSADQTGRWVCSTGSRKPDPTTLVLTTWCAWQSRSWERISSCSQWTKPLARQGRCAPSWLSRPLLVIAVDRWIPVGSDHPRVSIAVPLIDILCPVTRDYHRY